MSGTNIAPNQPLIRVENLCKAYNLDHPENQSACHQVLFNINLEIYPGEFIAIMGQSGSGKSTLMNILGCLDTPTAGSYWLAGRNVATFSSDELARVRNAIGLCSRADLLKRMTALDNVAIPLLYAGMNQ